MKINATKLVTIVATLSLTACATSEKSQLDILSQIEAQPLNVQNPLYGYLEKTKNGHYAFTKFTNKPNYVAPWVDFANLQPVWDTPRRVSCQTSNTGAGVCKDGNVNPKLFYVDQRDTDFGYWGATVFTFGLGLLFMPHSSVFDAKSYKIAVEEAANRFKDDNGFDISYAAKDFDSKHAAFKTQIKALEGDKFNRSKINVNMLVTDKSGYFAVDPLHDKAMSNFNRLLDFKENVANIPSYNAVGFLYRPAFFFNELQDYIKRFEAQRELLNVTYPRPNSMYGFNFDDGYLYETDHVSIIEKSDPNIKLNVKIDSLAQVDSVPKTYVAEDKFVKVEMNGDTYQFTNLTDTYVTLKDFSIYVNGDVQLTRFNQGYSLSVPPRTAIILNKIMLIEPISGDMKYSFKNVTAEKAMNTPVNFGYSVKYSVGDTISDRTLLKVPKMTLHALIMSRAKAGHNLSTDDKI